MLDSPLHAVPLAFLDFETTGLYPRRGDRVCEIALLRVLGDSVERSIDTLINPLRPLSAQSFAINRIAPEQLAAAPRFEAIIGALRQALVGAAIVAHNAPFDLEFLHAELALAGQPPLVVPAIDTLAVARRLFPRRQSYSLAALAIDLGIPAPSHRAMSDVLTLRGVFAAMVARLAEQDIVTLGDVLHYARGFERGQPPPEPPASIAVALREGRLLRIVYRSRSTPEPTERVIRPIEIVSQRGVLLLRAYCYLRDDLRTFVLEKMTVVEHDAPFP
jgi:DNA polymerase III subunit epsilon